jgi:hypothetical protein
MARILAENMAPASSDGCYGWHLWRQRRTGDSKGHEQYPQELTAACGVYIP